MAEPVMPESQAPEEQVYRVSALAIGALVLGIVPCPLVSLLGPVLGIMALSQMKRDPTRWGRGFAVAGIILGIITTVLFFGWGVPWVSQRIPQRVTNGPETPIIEALAGNVPEFQAQMAGEAAAASEQEVFDFVDTLRDRYGLLLDVRIDEERELDEAEVVTEQGQLVPYIYEFERATLRGAARSEFTLSGLELRFTEIYIQDPERGDLMFPPRQLDGGGEDADTGESIEPEPPATEPEGA